MGCEEVRLLRSNRACFGDGAALTMGSIIENFKVYPIDLYA
jgi:hypothetical protein